MHDVYIIKISYRVFLYKLADISKKPATSIIRMSLEVADLQGIVYYFLRESAVSQSIRQSFLKYEI
jgi:hypothetical protein